MMPTAIRAKNLKALNFNLRHVSGSTPGGGGGRARWDAFPDASAGTKVCLLLD